MFSWKFSISKFIGSKATWIFYRVSNLQSVTKTLRQLSETQFTGTLQLWVSNFCFIELSQNFCNWLELLFNQKESWGYEKFLVKKVCKCFLTLTVEHFWVLSVKYFWIVSVEHFWVMSKKHFLSNEHGTCLSNKHETFLNFFSLAFCVLTIFYTLCFEILSFKSFLAFKNSCFEQPLKVYKDYCTWLTANFLGILNLYHKLQELLDIIICWISRTIFKSPLLFLSNMSLCLIITYIRF